MTSMKHIEDCRVEIDKLNEQIIDLLGQRMQLAKKVGELKKELGLQVRDYEREHQVITSMRERAKLHHLPEEHVEQIFELIMKASRKVQR